MVHKYWLQLSSEPYEHDFLAISRAHCPYITPLARKWKKQKWKSSRCIVYTVWKIYRAICGTRSRKINRLTKSKRDRNIKESPHSDAQDHYRGGKLAYHSTLFPLSKLRSPSSEIALPIFPFAARQLRTGSLNRGGDALKVAADESGGRNAAANICKRITSHSSWPATQTR